MTTRQCVQFTTTAIKCKAEQLTLGQPSCGPRCNHWQFQPKLKLVAAQPTKNEAKPKLRFFFTSCGTRSETEIRSTSISRLCPAVTSKQDVSTSHNSGALCPS